MKKLKIENFSCIRSGEIEFDHLTIFIGPQASGKSVICKLLYFLINAAEMQQEAIIRKETFEKYSDKVKKDFLEWFPLEAWGAGKFKINLVIGNYEVALTRKAYKKVSADFRLEFCAAVREQYESMLKQWLLESEPPTRRRPELRHEFELDWKMREVVRKSLSALMGKDYVRSQFFIPAGRSFFTSIGKAIAAFEQGRILDPLIIQFGRLYTTFRSERVFYRDGAVTAQARLQLEKMLREILGGELRSDGDRDFVRMNDGREIPFSALSSGQQELLPIVAVLPQMAQYAGLCYIEEPEAHLFPAAQNSLVEVLAAVISRVPRAPELIVTTHSPYVLTKINNLIKAGSLGRRAEGGRNIEAIVPRRFWLVGKSVRAYAIIDGVVTSIMDADSFIDAEYIDGVSESLSREFSDLLEWEASNVK